MAITNNSDISANLFNGITNQANAKVSTINDALASGQKINQAADDPSGLAIVSTLNNQINSQMVASQNLNSGVSLLQTADGGAQAISESLQRLNTLSIQAANGTLNNAQRNGLNETYQQTLAGLNTTAENTQFNNQALLNGDTNSVPIALDQDSLNLNLANLSSDALGLNNSAINTPANAQSAQESIGLALEQLDTSRAQFGAQQNSLTAAMENIASQNSNATSTRSQINDTNYAAQLSDQVRQNIMQDSQIAMQAQSNQSRSAVLQLLNS